MRSAIVTIGVALLPLLLALSLSPRTAHAVPGPRTIHPAPHGKPMRLASLAAPGLSDLLPAAIQLPRSPASLVAMWLTGGVNRFLGLFSPGAGGPLLAPTGLALLTVTPVAGVESSGYGYRRDPMNRRRRKLHKGIDYKAARGTPVHAAGAGVVEVARRRGGYGRLVIITHGSGLETRYAHLRRIKVKEGQYVPAGALIGTVGSSGRSTGPHLHFEVRRYGEPMNPRWALGAGPIGPALATTR